MIEVKNVVKTFDGFAALNDATLSVPTGAVYGLVGPNGAGKSTIIRHLTGIFRQDSGTVRLGGEDVWENAALKAKIAAIPDDWYYFNSAGIGDMMRFYKGFIPIFPRSGMKSCGKCLNWTKSGLSGGFPRVCRSRRPSGWLCPPCRII